MGDLVIEWVSKSDFHFIFNDFGLQLTIPDKLSNSNPVNEGIDWQSKSGLDSISKSCNVFLSY